MPKTAKKKKESPSLSDQVKEEKIEAIIGPDRENTTKYVPEGYRRKNIVMRKDLMYKLKALAYWMGEPEYKANEAVWEDFLGRHKVKDIPPKKGFPGL